MEKGKIIILRMIVSILFSVLGMSMLFVLTSCRSKTEPQYTYEEFPMEITYKINDEIATKKEIYVVEYSGFNPELGYSYKGYIKSTDEDGIILYEEDNLKVICELGYADYYLGKVGRYENNVVPLHIYREETKNSFLFFKEKEYTVLTESELYEQYGIKIISWTTAEPLDDYWK